MIPAKEMIGSYRLIREIGRGGMGVVYLAEDTSLRRTVALKFLYPTLANDSAFIERFQGEAQSISRLESAHIVHINSFQHFDDGQVAIDMEYIGGGSLALLAAERKADPVTLAGIAYETLLGLQACHSLGIVHRDLKPSNILLTLRGQVKITDFGLATAYANHLESSVARTTSSSFFMGTPRFAPPEAWEGKTPTPLWDIYSLGIVFYEALTGVVPYDGTSPLAIVKQIMTERPRPVCELEPGVSRPLGQLVDAMLSHVPKERPASAEEAIHALKQTPECSERVDGNEITVAMPRPVLETIQEQERKPANRRLWLWRAGQIASVALLLLAAGATWWLFGSREMPAPVDEPISREAAAPPRSDVERILAQSRGAPDTYRVYDMSSVGQSDIPGLTILQSQGGGAGAQFTGFWDSGLLRARVTAENNVAFSLEGAWARYRDRYRRAVQYGALRGDGAWQAGRETFTVTLQLLNERDNTALTLTLSGQARDASQTDTGYFAELETASTPITLLYNELLPRNIAWAVELESELPAIPGSRIRVPMVSAADLAVDGAFSEEIWTGQYFDDSGRIGDWNQTLDPGPATARVRANSGHVMLAFTVPAADSDTLSLQLAVQDRVDLPAGLTARSIIEINSAGDITANRYVGTREVPWEFDWQAVASFANGHWNVEVAIPRTEYSDGKRWRMNAAIYREEDGEPATRVGCWGFPKPEETRHGAMMLLTSEIQSSG